MTDTTNKLTIEPLEGWTLQTPYGTLKNTRNEVLVRLEDIHTWLMKKKEIPSASAAAAVFGAFISGGNSELGMKHGAAKVRNSLYITDLSGHAEHFTGFYESKNLEKITEQIPYVPHHHFDRGTVAAAIYSLAIVAGEVWAPHVQDIDLNDRLDGYCAEGYFPSIEKCREILGHFAVPISLAHALWCWGRVVEGAGNVAEILPLHSAPSTIEPPEEWTGERLAAQQAVFMAEGRRDFAKRTWELAGVKERDGRRLVSEYEATKKTNEAVSKVGVSTVFEMGKAMAKKTKKRA